MDFAEIVLARMRDLGVNVNQAEARCGFEQGYIRGVVRNDDKRAVPSVDKARRIAEGLGLDFYIGPPRQPSTTRLPGAMQEPVGNGPPILGPPTGYVTFVWHHSCDPGTGIPPVAVSQAWATRHGLNPDAHLTVALGTRPERPQDPAAFAVIDPLAPRDGGPHPWAFRAQRDTGVEIGLVQMIDRKPLALPTPDHPQLRDLSAPGAILLGRVLWSASKPP